MMRKQYTSAFKAKVAQEILREEKTLAQIASEYEVYPTQLNSWSAIMALRALYEIIAESLWRTVKYEEVYLHDDTSPREARNQLRAYFEFDNHQRLHQALDYQNPAEVYSTGKQIFFIKQVKQ